MKSIILALVGLSTLGDLPSAHADEWLPDHSKIELVIVAGQSNATSRGVDTVYNNDLPVPGIFQIARTGSAPEPIIPAYEPLQFWQMNPNGAGFGYAFAVLLRKAEPDKQIVIIPAAAGQTSLGPKEWGPGGRYSIDLAKRANSIASRFDVEGCVFLWHQGEQEVVNKNINYTKDINASFDFMLKSAPGLSSCSIFFGGLADDFVLTHKPMSTKIMQEMQAVPWAHFVSAAGLPTQDGVHFTAMSQRELAKRYFESYQSADSLAAIPIVPQTVH